MSDALPGNRIAGRLSSGPDHHPITDPVTGATDGTVAGGGADAADAAVGEAARWVGRLSVTQRRSLLERVAAALGDRADELADIVVAETGKRRAEAVAEVGFSARYFTTFAELADGLQDERLALRDGATHVVSPRPVGVVAALTPWNFPVSIPARKIAPAIAAGCGVVFKPSERAPRSGLWLAALLDELGDEPGLVNVVSGTPESTVAPWLADPRVRSVTFTGSTAVGHILGEQCGARGIRLTSELGGDAPLVVLDDADVSAAVELLLVAKYRNNGQSCIAANQVWVPEPMLDEVTAAFVEASRALDIGDPRDPATDLGPLAPPRDPARLAGLAAEARSQGAEVIEAGTAPDGDGHWSPPVVCVGRDGMQPLAGQEVFGPLTQMAGYADLDHVVDQVSRSPYGLAGYVAGADLDRATTLAARLDVGIAGINTAAPNMPQVPFSGRKGSGIGYEGGRQGLEEFVAYQTLAVEPAATR